MAQYVIKLEETEGGGLSLDDVSALLENVEAGHRVAVFTDCGKAVYVSGEVGEFFDSVPEVG